MTVRLLIEESPAEIRAALVVDETVQRLWFPQDAETGAVYRGVIRQIDTRLQAAFVDIGQVRDGFLPIQNDPAVTEGKPVPVQIKRQATADKGALLALHRTEDQQFTDSFNQAVTPGRLGRVLPASVRAILQFQSFGPDEIIVSGTDSFLAVQAFLKKDAEMAGVKLSQHQLGGLFEEEGVEEAIEQALARTVGLQSGGRLVFDEAEALTAVDVDVAATPGQSKRGSIMRACAEAIPELVRQLNLRRIGGQVVIDFPALAVKGGGQIQSLLKQDIRSLPGGRLGRIDNSGLAILTLKRAHASLLDLMTEYFGPGPIQERRLTAKVIAARGLRQAEAALKLHPTANLELSAIDDVTDLIKRNPAWTDCLSERYGPRLSLATSDHGNREIINVREIT